jgi:type III secretion protein T
VDPTVLDEPMHLLASFGYAMPRLLVMFSLIPMLTRQALPGMLRTGVVAGVAVLLVPTLFDHVASTERGAMEITAVLCKEAVLGLLLGFIAAVPLWAFEAMGAFIDNQRGASIAQVLNPLTGHDSSPLGELFTQAALTYLLAGGGFLLLLGMVYGSYELWPVFAAWPSFDDDAALLMLGALDRLMHLALLLGAPVVIAMFLAELGLGLVSRFTPQLQVFFLAMAIKSAIAMFVFAVYAVALFDYGGPHLLDFGGVLETAGRILSKG